MLTTSNLSRRRMTRALAGAAALLGVAALPSSASAAYTVTNGVACNETVKQVFSQFGDTNLYALAPAGDIESSLTGWTLSKARAISGSEPYNITGTAGKYALQLDAGGVVTTSPVCVDPTRETFRLFVRNVSNAKARIKVEALFKKDGATTVTTSNVGYVTTSIGVWEPSPILKNTASKYVTAGTTASVRYRFTAENGAMVLDDLHIDPRYIG